MSLRREKAMSIDMKRCGLTERQAEAAGALEGLTVARVISQEKGHYWLLSEKGEKAGQVSGKLRYQAQTASAAVTDVPTRAHWAAMANSIAKALKTGE